MSTPAPAFPMTGRDVIELYDALHAEGVRVLVDGGWCVDALPGRQTRPHADLDLAVRRDDASRLRRVLRARGYRDEARDGETEWNYVMRDGHGRAVDVHVFDFDEGGAHIYGIEYPRGSLTGTGSIEGRTVRCISAAWMFEFKTAYPPQPKDLADVCALSARFGFEPPLTHHPFRG